jgi:cytochrome c553
MWLAVAAASIALCESCHGPSGNSVTERTPSIAAQPVTFLENQLVYFREELRHAPVMQGVAKGMKDEDISALAKHFSAQKAAVMAKGPAEPAKITLGRELAGKLHCGQCHLPQFQGQGQMARLAGQREDYLLEALTEYRDGKRSAADTTMTEVLNGLSDADIQALAHFMARSQ